MRRRTRGDRSAKRPTVDGAATPIAPILIAGCALSGLEQSAAIMSDLGCPCHFDRELAFYPSRAPTRMPVGACEASIAAVPFVPYLDRRTVLVHQVRSPLGNIADLIEWGLFNLEPSTLGPATLLGVALGRLAKASERRRSDPRLRYLRLLEFHRPELVIDSPVRAALRYWVLWNMEIEFYSPTFLHAAVARIEDPLEPVLRAAIVASGRAPAPSAVAWMNSVALSQPRLRISVNDLPDCWELDVAADLAGRLGYSL